MQQERTGSQPDSTLEKSRMSFISCRTKSPEDNITLKSCF